MTADREGLTVLAVDDERPALDDLTWLLDAADTVSEVIDATSGAEALRVLSSRDDVDAVLLDIQMGGLDGLELARLLGNFRAPPAVAFVTAFDEYAVDAFGLNAVDYLLKPVDQERLEETLRRITLRRSGPAARGATAELDRLDASVGTRTVTIERDDVEWVEAAGGYCRVHISTGESHLVSQTISGLTCAWLPHGFVRIHRGYLVRASAIREVSNVDGRRTVQVGAEELPVSRRYAKLLQDVLTNR
ncbi:LytR/AlgR family response regulator transcription factor [Euzebya tangerina]|uniref:LytR/AlgR family response regulator transcription factor n=1 Tax=Euzebya tangerina TaxID=591198 RepID=UPI000E321A43|nr:LytTR family DNA-binding domain-containing protein [Euzebya tangerina]